ncbi:MAG: DUF1559 domain-containing protein [Planctomycetes bacterium]|nr:DUF1559 domain-containing protein [Planctomycetota bacterium]
MSFAAFVEYGEGGRFYANSYSDQGEEVPYFIRGNFDSIFAALQAYHQDKGSYPPVATFDKDGKALLSWRVLILPYLEKRGRIDRWQRAPLQPNQKPPVVQTYADLYKRFKLDEPWDSMHNKQLLEQMPTAYNLDFTMQNWRMRTDWKTGVQVFTGPGTMFPGKEGVNKGQVRDGLETTIAVAFRNDVTNAVPWTKPADLSFAANRPVPKLFGLPNNYRNAQSFPTPNVFVLMADGQSRRFPPTFDEKAFRGLVTIDGGETVKLPEPQKESSPKFK